MESRHDGAGPQHDATLGVGGDRLAHAAAVLAHAEGVAGLRPGAGAKPTATEAADVKSTDVASSQADRPRGEVAVELDPHPPAQSEGQGAEAEAAARAIVMRQLAMTARSRGQLETKLRQRGCHDAVVAKVLDRVTELGLIDDEAYAGMLVRDHHSSKGLARGALAHELRKRGIDSQVAGEALAQVGTADERRRAEQLAAKKLRTMAGLTPDVQARRLGALLARKGYPGEIAWPVVRDAISGAPEHRRD